MSHPGLENKQYFRSIADLEQTPEFEQFLHREFPQAASEFPEGVSRRRWIQLMGASLALGGVTGCRYNREEIAAFVVRPEGRIAGEPEYFATNFEWAGRVVHALSTNVDGRPIKIDGNPEHPLHAAVDPSDFNDGKQKKFANAGCDSISQASVLSLYDPERLDAVLNKGKESTWADAEHAFEDSLKALLAEQGKGLAVVFEPTHSPSLQRALAEVKAKLPQAVFVTHRSVDRSNRTKALEAAGAGKTSLQYRLDTAKIIAAIDADLLGADPNAMVHARQYAKGRTPNASKEMNRLYVVESQYSVTGGAADFRLAVRSSQIVHFLAKLEAAIDAAKGGKTLDATGDKDFSELDAKTKVARTIEVMAADLVANQGASVVAVGEFQSVEVQQAALRINAKLGNIGKTVVLYEAASLMSGVETVELANFVEKSAEFNTVWVLGGNPVFSAAGDLKVADALAKVRTSVYWGDDDETAAVCTWVLPASNPLESWGDVRGLDGTYGVCQPLISVLKNGRCPLETLALLAGLSEKDPQKFVMGTAEKVVGNTLTKRQWKDILHAGYAAGSQFKTVASNVSTEGALPDGDVDVETIEQGKIELTFYPSESVYDGRLANNGWMQELPQPITKLTWDNAAIVSPRTAKKLGLVQGEKAQLTFQGKSIQLPVFIVPGHAEGSISAHLGYGRTRCGVVGKGVGSAVNAIRTTQASWILNGVEVKNTTVPYKLATTQDHFVLDTGGMKEIANRSPQLIREGTLKQFNDRETFAPDTYRPHHENKSLWKEPIDKIQEDPATAWMPQWAMTVDLNKCVGCNACITACQSENNVPIVGKDQVSRGREMHWLRLDRYFRCDFEKTTDFLDPVDVSMVHQPVACMHCETAPCEQVCPVAATVHTEEGINSMAYNRCIGTRYCANNCPYKVRRFNYYNYNTKYGYFYGWQDEREKSKTKLQSLVLNPEVTVRGRGVMEKCTYCIQRVQNGKIKARQTGDGQIHDGDITTACQDACPTQAIVFGSLTDKSSRVSQLQDNPRAYELLEELNVKARTKYLARLRNVPRRLMTRVQLNPPVIHDHGHGSHGHEDHDAHKAESKS